MTRKRPGFSLVEMMVAVAIIAALIAMFFIGYKYVSSGAKKNQSKASLQALRAMLNEYEISGGSMTDLYSGPNPLPAPGSVNEKSADRTGSAVENTRAVMKKLLQVPDNKKMFDSLPRGKPSKDGQPVKGEDGMVWETDAGPVLLDAYYNPIIFVPGKGLSGVGLIKKPSSDSSSPPTYARSGQTIQAPGGSASTPGKPFFASAGEGGSFIDGDDNKYSFEN